MPAGSESRRKLVRADLERMGLPRGLWGTRLSAVNEPARDVIRRYLLNIEEMLRRGAGMYLWGPTGVGKSGIAALVCKEAVAAGFTAYWTSVWELRECIRNRIPFDDGLSVLDRCKAVDVLVFDGFYPEDRKEYVFTPRDFVELLASRASGNLTTLLTSTMPPAVLDAELPNLTDVMRGCMVNVEVKGQNLRDNREQELREAVFGGSR